MSGENDQCTGTDKKNNNLSVAECVDIWELESDPAETLPMIKETTMMFAIDGESFLMFTTNT